MNFNREISIRAAGLHLLETLKSKEVVRLGSFFLPSREPTESFWKRLCNFRRAPPGVRFFDYQPSRDRFMMETAAWQLEDFGYVRITCIHSYLADGDADCEIRLTAAGHLAVAKGVDFLFRDVDYWFDPEPASRFLISSLSAVDCTCDDGPTLSQIMAEGDRLPKVEIKDSRGNWYRFGTGTYAWAFDIALWNHVHQEHIEPFHGIGSCWKTWARIVMQNHPPSRPRVSEAHSLWEVPLRLRHPFLENATKQLSQDL